MCPTIRPLSTGYDPFAHFPIFAGNNSFYPKTTAQDMLTVKSFTLTKYINLDEEDKIVVSG